jgi:hypothetical protein
MKANAPSTGSLTALPPVSAMPAVAETPHPDGAEGPRLDDVAEPSAVPPKRVVLPASWFRFILPWMLRQAIRRSDFLSLVTIRSSREYIGLSVEVASQSLAELAEVVGPSLRETDLMGELEDGQLGLLLMHADEDAASRVIQRFGETLGDVRFSVSLGFAIGSACCPTNGIDMNGLLTHALAHPVLNVRARPPAFDEPSFAAAH